MGGNGRRAKHYRFTVDKHGRKVAWLPYRRRFDKLLNSACILDKYSVN